MGQPLLFFINPGAVEGSFGAAGGHEFAFIDTENDIIIFSRIQNPIPTKKSLCLGIISDSFDVSEMIPDFWGKLCKIFQTAGVTHIIHCGNIDNNDIGLPCLEKFEVFYNLRTDQENNKNMPKNWHLVSCEYPVVEIESYKFLVQLSLGPELLDQSEMQMHRRSLGLQKEYSGVHYILCGQTRTPFLEEAQNVMLLNPGGVMNNREYAIVKLPRHEITFGRIQRDSLPLVK
jgi:predicted phosphodiesterase